jgi:hypothetical protein
MVPQLARILITRQIHPFTSSIFDEQGFDPPDVLKKVFLSV